MLDVGVYPLNSYFEYVVTENDSYLHALTDIIPLEYGDYQVTNPIIHIPNINRMNYPLRTGYMSGVAYRTPIGFVTFDYVVADSFSNSNEVIAEYNRNPFIQGTTAAVPYNGMHVCFAYLSGIYTPSLSGGSDLITGSDGKYYELSLCEPLVTFDADFSVNAWGYTNSLYECLIYYQEGSVVVTNHPMGYALLRTSLINDNVYMKPEVLPSKLGFANSSSGLLGTLYSLGQTLSTTLLDIGEFLSTRIGNFDFVYILSAGFGIYVGWCLIKWFIPL